MPRYSVWDEEGKAIVYSGLDHSEAVKKLESLDCGFLRQYTNLGNRILVSQSFWNQGAYQADDTKSCGLLLEPKDLELILEESKEI